MFLQILKILVYDVIYCNHGPGFNMCAHLRFVLLEGASFLDLIGISLFAASYPLEKIHPSNLRRWMRRKFLVHNKCEISPLKKLFNLQIGAWWRYFQRKTVIGHLSKGANLHTWQMMCFATWLSTSTAYELSNSLNVWRARIFESHCSGCIDYSVGLERVQKLTLKSISPFEILWNIS